MKKILFFIFAFAGLSMTAQTAPKTTPTKVATKTINTSNATLDTEGKKMMTTETAAAKTSATTGTKTTKKKIHNTATTVESTADGASKYTDNKLLKNTKSGATTVKDATKD